MLLKAIQVYHLQSLRVIRRAGTTEGDRHREPGILHAAVLEEKALPAACSCLFNTNKLEGPLLLLSVLYDCQLTS